MMPDLAAVFWLGGVRLGGGLKDDFGGHFGPPAASRGAIFLDVSKKMRRKISEIHLFWFVKRT